MQTVNNIMEQSTGIILLKKVKNTRLIKDNADICIVII
jgi:hypothetical protein